MKEYAVLVNDNDSRKPKYEYSDENLSQYNFKVCQPLCVVN